VVFNSVGGTATQGAVQLPAAESPKVGFGYPADLLVWHKTEAAGGTPLAGATFQVTGPHGFSQVVLDDGPGDLSSVPGTVEIQVSPGTYTITEITAPDGYALSTATLNASFDTTGQTVDAGTITDQPWVQVFIQKWGLATDNQPVAMPGSTWQVSSDQGGSPGGVAPGVAVAGALDATGTPVTGLWQVSNLVAGTYWLTETSAPAGFSLLASPVQFTIGPDGALVMGTGAGAGATALVSASAGTAEQAPWWIINVHDVPAVRLPETGGSGNGPWRIGGGLLLMTAGCWTILYRLHRPTPPRHRKTITVRH
ncbi:MAG: SpaA isopeptide-forming pilin-related protein, partial [Micrococcales bacterium]|nr:SpaA isopeptide-forming pilin-related protein [Micrococcales bacterium]